MFKYEIFILCLVFLLLSFAISTENVISSKRQIQTRSSNSIHARDTISLLDTIKINFTNTINYSYDTLLPFIEIKGCEETIISFHIQNICVDTIIYLYTVSGGPLTPHGKNITGILLPNQTVKVEYLYGIRYGCFHKSALIKWHGLGEKANKTYAIKMAGNKKCD